MLWRWLVFPPSCRHRNRAFPGHASIGRLPERLLHIWINPFRSVDVDHAAGVVALLLFGQAAHIKRVGVIRFEPDRLVVVRDGAVLITLVAPGVAAIEV